MRAAAFPQPCCREGNLGPGYQRLPHVEKRCSHRSGSEGCLLPETGSYRSLEALKQSFRDLRASSDGLAGREAARRSRTRPGGLALASKETRRTTLAETRPFMIRADATCTDGVCGGVGRCARGLGYRSRRYPAWPRPRRPFTAAW